MTRTVFCVMLNGDQVVRYPSTGKWFLEPHDQSVRKRQHIKVKQASDFGAKARVLYGGLPGGRVFYRLLGKRR